MDEELYDDFGNPVVCGREGFEREASSSAGGSDVSVEDSGEEENGVVLHEDKLVYPSHQTVYGENVEVLFEDEDMQELDQPIILPEVDKRFFVEDNSQEIGYSKEFLINMMPFSERIFSLYVFGDIHHGKTSFIDLLLSDTHVFNIFQECPERYTDIYHMERQRGTTLHSKPISFVMSNSKSRSFLVNMIDTPGHVDFVDEIFSVMSVSDGGILVVDVLEGLMANTERILRRCIKNRTKLILVVSKLDRLILELRLPPNDAYHKIKHTIDEINTFITNNRGEDLFQPEKGNVLFASSKFYWLFSLQSFSKIYGGKYRDFDCEEFSKRLWGDVYYDSELKEFVLESKEEGMSRAFTTFILEPLYKIYSTILGENKDAIKKVVKGMGINIKNSEYELERRDLIKVVMIRFINDSSKSFMDSVLQHIPNSKENARNNVDLHYLGPLSGPIYDMMCRCESKDHLMVLVVRFVPKDDDVFYCVGKVVCGVLKKDQEVIILGENYTESDQEDITKKKIKRIFVSGARYKIEVETAYPGNIVFIEGIDSFLMKMATITNELTYSKSTEEVCNVFPFRNSISLTPPVVKIAIEPVNPSELPKMLDGIRKINKFYPSIVTRVEESGEYMLMGGGEFYLDCVLNDLRNVFTGIDIRVSDPVVKFYETVVEMSSIVCYSESPNKKNRISMIAEPIQRKLSKDIVKGVLKDDIDLFKSGEHKRIEKLLVEEYEWDIFSARNVWDFGLDESESAILLDDTFPNEVDKVLLYTIKDSIKHGFQWGIREGPLCNEPMKDVKFRIVGANISENSALRGSGQIIPTVKRVIYSSFLMASPKLMEPIYSVEIQTQSECVNVIYTLLSKRRGHVVKDLTVCGSPFRILKALIPIIDSFGFEADLRTYTHGMAFCKMFFDHWEVVPGDPMDKSIVFSTLEPSPEPHLARDFMLKTRKRKGLHEDPTISKFLDDEMLLELEKHGNNPSYVHSGLA